jgi:glycosyltransferase involved in cell wall biosynthesis
VTALPSLGGTVAETVERRAEQPLARRQRVVVLTHANAWGGTEINTLGVARSLAAHGHEVTILQLGHALYDRYVAAPRPFGTVAVTLPVPFDDLPIRWWRRLLRPYRPDVLLLSKGGFGIQTPALDVAARLHARRYILLEHHPADPPPPRSSRRHLGGLVPGLALWWWRQQLAQRLHLRMAHRVITDSEFVTGLLAEHYALPRARAALVHCGIDVDAFEFREQARRRLREQWGIPADALVLGAVGRLVQVKGYDRALRSLRALREARPSLALRFVLAGEGPEREPLLQLASELGVADLVALPGFVADAADALSALDVYLMPSRAEGLGMALLEAMACERVCVAINSGGPAEILTDATLGWLTPADDEDAFTAALCDAVALSADERAALGRRARAHVMANFDGRRQAELVAQLVESA